MSSSPSPSDTTTPALAENEYPDYYYYQYYGDYSGGLFCRLRDHIGERVTVVNHSLDSMIRYLSQRDPITNGSRIREEEEELLQQFQQVTQTFIDASADLMTKDV